MLRAIKKMMPEPLKDWYRGMRYRLPILYRQLLRDDPSQAGEVSAVRKRLTPDFPRVVIDVGANDGYHLSNSYPFVRDGWKALLVEPHPEVFKRLSALHAKHPNAICEEVGCGARAATATFHLPKDPTGVGATACTDDNDKMRLARSDTRQVTIQIAPLTDLLDKHRFPADIGLLSVDAEGLDYDVLLGLDFARYRPRLIIMEEYTENASQFAARNEFLRRQGYQMVQAVGCNSLWASAPVKAPAGD